MSPENTVTGRYVTLTVTDITVFPPGERWGRMPFVTTISNEILFLMAEICQINII